MSEQGWAQGTESWLVTIWDFWKPRVQASVGEVDSSLPPTIGIENQNLRGCAWKCYLERVCPEPGLCQKKGAHPGLLRDAEAPNVGAHKNKEHRVMAGRWCVGSAGWGAPSRTGCWLSYSPARGELKWVMACCGGRERSPKPAGVRSSWLLHSSGPKGICESFRTEEKWGCTGPPGPAHPTRRQPPTHSPGSWNGTPGRTWSGTLSSGWRSTPGTRSALGCPRSRGLQQVGTEVQLQCARVSRQPLSKGLRKE